MTKKKILLIACAVVALVAIAMIVLISKNRTTTKETLSPILGYTAEEEAALPEVTKAFLQRVSCDVIEVNDGDHTAIVAVKAPDLTGVLQEVIAQTIEENSGLDYEQQLSLARHKFAETIRTGEFPIRESQLTLYVDEDTGKVIPDDTLYDFVFYDFKVMHADAMYEMAGGSSDE